MTKIVIPSLTALRAAIEQLRRFAYVERFREDWPGDTHGIEDRPDGSFIQRHEVLSLLDAAGEGETSGINEFVTAALRYKRRDDVYIEEAIREAFRLGAALASAPTAPSMTRKQWAAKIVADVRAIDEEGQSEGLSAEKIVEMALKLITQSHHIGGTDDMMNDGRGKTDKTDKPAPTAGTWHPIASAPKDGTNFLAASSASSVFMAHWANGVVDTTSYDETTGGYEGRYATHWMPIPNPPKEQS